MKVTLTILAILILIAVAIHLTRHFKLKSLQKKRNNCDLSTKEGRLKAIEYNERINRLMNFDNDFTR